MQAEKQFNVIHYMCVSMDQSVQENNIVFYCRHIFVYLTVISLWGLCEYSKAW